MREHLAALPLAERLLGKCVQALRIGMNLVLASLQSWRRLFFERFRLRILQQFFQIHIQIARIGAQRFFRGAPAHSAALQDS